MRAHKDSKYNRIRYRIFEIIQIGNISDLPSKLVDLVLAVAIISNIASVFLETFDRMSQYQALFSTIEYVTAILFTIEYVLRLWTADYLYPSEEHIMGAELRFIFSVTGIIDLCCFVPFYLPFVFPSGLVAFRILRVLRIFRLLRVNAYYDAFNVITDVINEKKNQLISAVFIILILIMASSLIMYNLEHEAQPEAFRNAFSGIWWSVATMLTVGYGDIYPVTTAGQIVAIIMSFLGVGLVAIPTGIISAGFVEKWSHMNAVSHDNYAPSGALDKTIDPSTGPMNMAGFRAQRRPKNVISRDATIKLLETEKRGVLSVIGDGGYPYTVPVNYKYDSSCNRIYIHGSKVGHKNEAIRKNSKVCFTVYGNEFSEEGDWAPYVQSAVVFGKCYLIDEINAVTEKTRLLAQKYYPSQEEIEEEIAKDIHGVQLYEIVIEHMSGKQIHEK